MVRNSMLFLVVAIIASLLAFSEVAFTGLATSVVPGWHVTVYPPFFLVSVGQFIWICLLPLFYYLVERSGRSIPKGSMLFHLCCTLTAFFSTPTVSAYSGFYQSHLWVLVPLGIFVVGQLYFLFVIFRNVMGIIK